MPTLFDLYEEHDECAEIADGIATNGIATYADALALVTRRMGTPAEIGYQIHDNIAEALWRLARPQEG